MTTRLTAPLADMAGNSIFNILVRYYVSQEIENGYEFILREEDRSFAAACNGRVGWFDGNHPQCCGNCRA